MCYIIKVKMITEGSILNMQYFLYYYNLPCDPFNCVLSYLWITRMILDCEASRMHVDFVLRVLRQKSYSDLDNVPAFVSTCYSTENSL